MDSQQSVDRPVQAPGSGSAAAGHGLATTGMLAEAVKAPLAAVLDQIVSGQRDELTQLSVRAPAGPLVGERAASTRERLVAKGLAETRVALAGSSGSAVVRIVIADATAP